MNSEGLALAEQAGGTDALMTASHDTTPIARVTGAVKRYGSVLALDHVDFEIGAGEVRALLGKNGAGKSTLIRLLSGAEPPTEGTVEITGAELRGSTRAATDLGVRTVYQELSLLPEISIAENLFIGDWPRRAGAVDTARMRREATSALAAMGLSVDPALPVAAISAANQQLVEVARAVFHRPRLLILDEPTSSLAAHETEIVLEAVRRIAATGVAVIFVSHRMAEIRRVASSVTVVRDGSIVAAGPIGDFSDADIVRHMLGRAQAASVAIEQRAAGGPVALSVEHLCVPPKVRDVSFDLHPGEVLGIAGLLGSGRSETLRAIAGAAKATAGTVVVNGVAATRRSPRKMRAHRVGFTPESRKDEGIVPAMGVDENITMSDFTKVRGPLGISGRAVAVAATAVIARLSIKVATPSTPIETLSGGNQQKGVIGRWLHAECDVLLLDEPTRGVDVEAKAQIYAVVRGLSAEGRAVLVVTSEYEELTQLCDRVIVLRDGVVAAEFRAPNIVLDQLVHAAIADQEPE